MQAVKVLYTVGCPGSGKTTWAQEYQDKNTQPNAEVAIVCRDDIRLALDPTRKQHQRKKFEDLVTDTHTEQLKAHLLDERVAVIIIADTNLNPIRMSTSKALIMGFIKGSTGRELTIEDVVFDVHYSILVKRNAKRGINAVPSAVLDAFYKRMKIYLNEYKCYKPDVDLPKAVIFDLDGTLADNNHRSPFEYHKLSEDTLVDSVANVLKLYHSSGYKIICLSGRNAGTASDVLEWYKLTDQWLTENNIPADKLFMRHWNDYRKDDIVKEEIFWDSIAPYYNVEVAFDDRSTVVAMWRRIGLKCFQVQPGDF